MNSSSPSCAPSVPEEFLCPLTLEVIHDGVMSKYGHHFEKSAIMEWLQSNDRCPLTRQPLSPSMIITDYHFNERIKAWKRLNGMDQSNDPSAPPPREFICPLTEKIMTNPVRTEYGDVFERQAILDWLEDYDFCPSSGHLLQARQIYTDAMLYRRIKLWKDTHGYTSGESDGEEDDKPTENEESIGTRVAMAPRKTSFLFKWRHRRGEKRTRRLPLFSRD